MMEKPTISIVPDTATITFNMAPAAAQHQQKRRKSTASNGLLLKPSPSNSNQLRRPASQERKRTGELAPLIIEKIDLAQQKFHSRTRNESPKI